MREPELSIPAVCSHSGSASPDDLQHPSHREQLIRLRRIEGQVRGIAKMIDNDQYCVDILTQIRAVKAAISAVETNILGKHLKHCLKAALATGDAAVIDRKMQELIDLSLRAGARSSGA